jgi:hypothetical protein
MLTALQLPLRVRRQRRQQQALVLRRHAAPGRVAVGAGEDHVRDHALGVRAMSACRHKQLWMPGEPHAVSAATRLTFPSAARAACLQSGTAPSAATRRLRMRRHSQPA